MENETKSLTLINRLNEYEKLTYEILNMAGDDVPEETAKALDAAVASLCEKADSYGFVMDRLKLFVEQCAKRKEEWAQGERTAKNSIESMKARMRFALTQLPEQSISGQEYRFFLTKPTAKLTIEPSEVPREYQKAEIAYKPDKEKIEKAIAAGQSIPGVTVSDSQQLRTGRPQ